MYSSTTVCHELAGCRKIRHFYQHHWLSYCLSSVCLNADTIQKKKKTRTRPSQWRTSEKSSPTASHSYPARQHVDPESLSGPHCRENRISAKNAKAIRLGIRETTFYTRVKINVQYTMIGADRLSNRSNSVCCTCRLHRVHQPAIAITQHSAGAKTVCTKKTIKEHSRHTSIM